MSAGSTKSGRGWYRFYRCTYRASGGACAGMDIGAYLLERHVRDWVMSLADDIRRHATGSEDRSHRSRPTGPDEQTDAIIRLADGWDDLGPDELNAALRALLRRIYVERGPSARSPRKDQRVLLVPIWEDDPILRQWEAGEPPTGQNAATHRERGSARSAILTILSERPATAAELGTALSMSVQAISRHLRRLAAADLVVLQGTRRAGKTTARLFAVTELGRRGAGGAKPGELVLQPQPQVPIVTGARQMDVLRLLAVQKRTVKELAQRLGFSEINGRKHVQLLAKRGLIAAAGRASSGKGRPGIEYELTPGGQEALRSGRHS